MLEIRVELTEHIELFGAIRSRAQVSLTEFVVWVWTKIYTAHAGPTSEPSTGTYNRKREIWVWLSRCNDYYLEVLRDMEKKTLEKCLSNPNVYSSAVLCEYISPLLWCSGLPVRKYSLFPNYFACTIRISCNFRVYSNFYLAPERWDLKRGLPTQGLYLRPCLSAFVYETQPPVLILIVYSGLRTFSRLCSGNLAPQRYFNKV